MFTLILGKGLAHLAHLLIAQAPQQLDRRRRDSARDLGNGLAGLGGAGLHGGIGDLAVFDHLLHTLEPVQVVRHLSGAMPVQMFLEAFTEPVFLPAVHVHVVAEGPGDDHVQIAIGQADPRAGAEGQAQEQQPEEGGRPVRHG